MNKWVYALISYVLLGGLVFVLTSGHYRKVIERMEPEIVRDTTVVVDTMVIEKPVYKYSKVVDTITVWRDSVVVKDSLIYLPRTEKVYMDSTYTAIVSGYQPSLDKIVVYPKTVTITDTKIVKERQKTPWGVGVQVGYGVSSDMKLNPYIGIGISYNILRF